MIKVTYDIKLGSADHSDMITPFLINTKKASMGVTCVLSITVRGTGPISDAILLGFSSSFSVLKKV